MDGIEVCLPDTHQEIYEILDYLIGHHHAHLAEARIVMCLNYDWKPDTDGHLKLIEVARATPILRAICKAKIDLIVTINALEFDQMDEVQRKACIDEALCRCKERRDPAGVTIGYRVGKHDFSGMLANVQRFGPWQTTLKTVKRFLNAEEEGTLFDHLDPEHADTNDITDAVVISYQPDAPMKAIPAPMHALPEGQSS